MESGSGVVVSPDGLVLTASTLLAPERTITVLFIDGRSFAARVVATDRGTESALLQIQGAASGSFSALTLADSSLVRVGQRAISAGNPLDSIANDRQRWP